MSSNIKYVKLNNVHFKSLAARQEGTKIFIEFFDNICKQDIGRAMQGHAILESIADENESIVLTFWENEDGMKKFYSPDNKHLANLVERAKNTLKICQREMII